MSGKGSAPRPYSVTNDEYANRWDAIFAKKEDPLQKLHDVEVELGIHWSQNPCPHNAWAIHSSSTKDNTVYVCMECGEKAASPSAGVQLELPLENP